MKLLSSIFVLCIMFSFVSCSSSDNEEIVHTLVPIDYSDLHRYRGTAKGGVKMDYSDIIVNKSDSMLDTLKIFINTATQTTLSTANKVAFSFLQEGKMKYVDYGSKKQIIADRFDLEDSIYVLRDNNRADSVFVVRNKGELSNDYFRTLSVYRFKQGDIDKEEIIEGEILDWDIVLKKLELTEANLKVLEEGEYLIWANVYYRYQ